MKKLLLGIGAVSIVALPVLSVVSCSTETSEKEPVKPVILDFKITVNGELTKEMLTKAHADFTKADASDADKLAALLPVFTDLSADTLLHIAVSFPEAKITLTADAGYTINGGKSLVAEFKEIPVE